MKESLWQPNIESSPHSYIKRGIVLQPVRLYIAISERALYKHIHGDTMIKMSIKLLLIINNYYFLENTLYFNRCNLYQIISVQLLPVKIKT